MPPNDPDLPFHKSSINITIPHDGFAVRPGDDFTVRGTTTADPPVTVTAVKVQYGENAQFKPALKVTSNWSKWFLTNSVPTSGSHKITAQMSVQFGSQGTGTTKTTISVIGDETSPTLNITEVNPGNSVTGSGPNFPITLRGTASDAQGVSSVKIRVGNESFPVSGKTEWESNVLLRGEGTHTIVVVAEDLPGNLARKTMEVTAADTEGPILNILEPLPLPPEVEDTVVTVRGSASDGTGIDGVKWRLDGGEFRPAFKETEDWSMWRANIPIPNAGQHTIEFTAQDTASAKNTTAQTLKWEFTTTQPKEIPGITQGAYLQDLLQLAQNYITVADGTNIDAAVLSDTFHQPFGRIGDGAAEGIVNRNVSKVRIAVEALRGIISDATNKEETAYRKTAYFTMLRNLGTSYEEVRLSRSADDYARRSLANRLGFDVEVRQPGAPPDAIDKLFMSIEQLTHPEVEHSLETIFGIVDTRPSVRDPLEDGAAPELLTWRKQFLRAQWTEEDHPTDAAEGDIFPVVEPDLVRVADIKNATAGILVFDLWNERRKWVEEQLEALRAKQEDGFDSVIAVVIKTIDLEEIASQHAAGVDIEFDLINVGLTLEAFLQLLRISRLAALGDAMITEAEWEDVFAILVQAKKRIEAFAKWNDTEKKLGIILGPDDFTLASINDAAIVNSENLPRWRTDFESRLRWEQTLSTRIRQDRSLGETLAATVAATEEETLPLLRDILVSSINFDEKNIDVNDWLARRLQIEIFTSGAIRTTRLQQAIETLLGVLFSLRTKRQFNQKPPLPFGDWKLANEQAFDTEWRWVGSFETWRAAIFVFGYPQNYLLPSLRPTSSEPTWEQSKAFENLVKSLRLDANLTPAAARQHIDNYLDGSNSDGDPPFSRLEALIKKVNSLLLEDQQIDPATFRVDVAISVAHTRELQRAIMLLFDKGGFNNFKPPNFVSEICYFVPLLVGLNLQRAAQYLVALDYFRIIYAYDFPQQDRKIYHGLKIEEDLQEVFQRPAQWLLEGLNPHDIAVELSPRYNAYSRFTIMSIVRCFLEFADVEFTQGTNESITRARTLYIAALDLLNDLDSSKASDGETLTFPSNPVPASLRLHVEINLQKLRNGLNIAGLERETFTEASSAEAIPLIGTDETIVLPFLVSFTIRLRIASLFSWIVPRSWSVLPNRWNRLTWLHSKNAMLRPIPCYRHASTSSLQKKQKNCRHFGRRRQRNMSSCHVCKDRAP